MTVCPCGWREMKLGPGFGTAGDGAMPVGSGRETRGVVRGSDNGADEEDGDSGAERDWNGTGWGT